MNLSYKDAGVDLEAAEAVVKRIAELAKTTNRQGVLGGIGHFGAFFELDLSGYSKPVMVSSVDGVGTKVKVACAMDRYKDIGRDLVNHCVNDIMCSGADPLYFLDYLSLSRIEGHAVIDLAEGLAEACRQNGVALIGGETAEMPDIYKPGEFDIAGCIVGIVDKDNIIDGSAVSVGDVLIGIRSSGLHTNGYSLARKIVELSEDAGYYKQYDDLGMSMGEALLIPHRSYSEAIKALRKEAGVHGISHITGGGIEGNTRRLLRDDQELAIDWDAWQWPPLFQLLQKLGNVTVAEMRSVFNLGIGMVFVVAPDAVKQVEQKLRQLGESPVQIGTVIHRSGEEAV